MTQNKIDSSKPIITVRNVSVAYKNVAVLWDVNGDVPEGSLVAIIGPNGAGKSTLIKTIMGIIKPKSGKIKIMGQELKNLKKIHEKISYMPQRDSIDDNFPVNCLDVVLMGRYGHMGWFKRPSKEDRQLALDALRKFDMEDFADRQIGALSGGQKQRVLLARSYVQDADIWVLDEPFGGIDANRYLNTLIDDPNVLSSLDRIARQDRILELFKLYSSLSPHKNGFDSIMAIPTSQLYSPQYIANNKLESNVIEVIESKYRTSASGAFSMKNTRGNGIIGLNMLDSDFLVKYDTIAARLNDMLDKGADHNEVQSLATAFSKEYSYQKDIAVLLSGGRNVQLKSDTVLVYDVIEKKFINLNIQSTRKNGKITYTVDQNPNFNYFADLFSNGQLDQTKVSNYVPSNWQGNNYINRVNTFKQNNIVVEVTDGNTNFAAKYYDHEVSKRLIYQIDPPTGVFTSYKPTSGVNYQIVEVNVNIKVLNFDPNRNTQQMQKIETAFPDSNFINQDFRKGIDNSRDQVENFRSMVQQASDPNNPVTGIPLGAYYFKATDANGNSINIFIADGYKDITEATQIMLSILYGTPEGLNPNGIRRVYSLTTGSGLPGSDRPSISSELMLGNSHRNIIYDRFYVKGIGGAPKGKIISSNTMTLDILDSSMYKFKKNHKISYYIEDPDIDGGYRVVTEKELIDIHGLRNFYDGNPVTRTESIISDKLYSELSFLENNVDKVSTLDSFPSINFPKATLSGGDTPPKQVRIFELESRSFDSGTRIKHNIMIDTQPELDPATGDFAWFAYIKDIDPNNPNDFAYHRISLHDPLNPGKINPELVLTDNDAMKMFGTGTTLDSLDTIQMRELLSATNKYLDPPSRTSLPGHNMGSVKFTLFVDTYATIKNYRLKRDFLKAVDDGSSARWIEEVFRNDKAIPEKRMGLMEHFRLMDDLKNMKGYVSVDGSQKVPASEFYTGKLIESMSQLAQSNNIAEALAGLHFFSNEVARFSFYNYRDIEYLQWTISRGNIRGESSISAFPGPYGDYLSTGTDPVTGLPRSSYLPSKQVFDPNTKYPDASYYQYVLNMFDPTITPSNIYEGAPEAELLEQFLDQVVGPIAGNSKQSTLFLQMLAYVDTVNAVLRSASQGGDRYEFATKGGIYRLSPNLRGSISGSSNYYGKGRIGDNNALIENIIAFLKSMLVDAAMRSSRVIGYDSDRIIRELFLTLYM